MFVRNRTTRNVVLARGRFLDDLAVAAIVWRATYRVVPQGLVPWEGERARLDTDPPDTASRPLWHGTSVTVAGHVHGPGRSSRAVRVELRVGNTERSLLVWGERRWVKNAGRLVPSLPAPWTERPLSWSLAFGGGYEIPAGPHPISKLPQPAGRVVHPANPAGVGLYASVEAAEGNVLPSIEAPEQPMRQWNDWVRPAGFAPCPDLDALRMPEDLRADQLSTGDVEAHLRLALRMAHPAPGELVFGWLEPGTPVELRGARPQPFCFEVPPSPLRIAPHGAKVRPDTPPRVRLVHVSLDDGAVVVEHAHPFIYEPKTAPGWVAVEEP